MADINDTLLILHQLAPCLTFLRFEPSAKKGLAMHSMTCYGDLHHRLLEHTGATADGGLHLSGHFVRCKQFSVKPGIRLIIESPLPMAGANGATADGGLHFSSLSVWWGYSLCNFVMLCWCRWPLGHWGGGRRLTASYTLAATLSGGTNGLTTAVSKVRSVGTTGCWRPHGRRPTARTILATTSSGKVMHNQVVK